MWLWGDRSPFSVGLLSSEDRLVQGSHLRGTPRSGPHGATFGHREGKDRVKLQETMPKTSDRHFFQSLGVPKTTLRLDNLLEGQQELVESCYTHGYGL